MATGLFGREVATLMAGETVSAGVHTMLFHAAGLASGSYLIRMEAGSFAATQRVTLLKQPAYLAPVLTCQNFFR